MLIINRQLVLIFTFCFFTAAVHAESLWQEKYAQAKPDQVKSNRVVAQNARYLQINSSLLDNTFSTLNSASEMTLPLPDGSNILIKLSPSQILSEDLAAQYPGLMTYQAEQINQAKNIGRFSISHLGLFGFFRYNNQWMLLSPRYKGEEEEYASYWYKYAPSEPKIENLTKDFLLAETELAQPRLAEKLVTTGDSVKTYRLAISTTSGYSQKNGGSKANVLAELMNLVNRINQILLVDLAIQFELIDNQDLIFLDAASDPFTDSDSATDIETNQQVVDQAIGNENYDMAHVLGTDGGGLAFVGVLCNSSFKAKGYTGLSNPQGERFYIDLVAHEFGHQLGAEHSFNATNSESCDEGQRKTGTAYEPGSGSTIMSYAGICGTQNLQFDSDPYFHAISIEQIRDVVDRFSLRNCGVQSNLDNAIPQIQLTQSTYTIPANTPFVLEAQGSDTDNDGLTYTWEQFDNGGTTGATSSLNELNTDNGSNPLFRSFNPTDTAQRYFPKLSDVLAGQTSIGETYATTDRDMRFRLTVRDNKGGVNQQDLVITVTTANQTFSVNSPSQWQAATTQTLTWDIGDSATAPVNCNNVDISLIADTNNPIEISVLNNTPNDGQQVINVPNVSSDSAHLILKCSNNIFYAATAEAFAIAHAQPVVPSIDSQNAISLNEDAQRTIIFSDLNVSDADSSYPDEFTLTIQGGNNFSINQNTVTPEPNFNGELNVPVVVNDGQLGSNTFLLHVQVTAVNDAPVAVNDTLTVQQNSNTTTVNVLNNDSDVDMDVLSIDSFTYSGQGQVAMINQQLTYAPASGFTGTESIDYVVTDGTLSDQARLSIQVNAVDIGSPDSGGGGSIWLLSFLSLLCLSLQRYQATFKHSEEGSYE